MKLNMNNDFGFSFEDEPVDKTHEVLHTKDQHRKDLEDIESLILPLLRGLKKDPDKAMIKWKNRLEVVSKLEEQLLSITSRKDNI